MENTAVVGGWLLLHSYFRSGTTSNKMASTSELKSSNTATDSKQPAYFFEHVFLLIHLSMELTSAPYRLAETLSLSF